MSQARVLIVGGGVIGLSCAHALAQRGVEVEVLERSRVGAGASSGNAGTVSAGHPPLNRPGRVWQGLSQMLDSTSPLYIRPRWDPQLWRWLLGFARTCTDSHVEHSMRIMAPLGMQALASFDALIEEEAIDCGYRMDGYFDVCATESGLGHARQEAAIIERHGYHPEALDGEGLRQAEPGLGPRVLGGVFYPEARTLNPADFLAEMSDRIRQRGHTIREGVEVVTVEATGGRATGVTLADGSRVDADAVVLATGPFVQRISGELGAPLPVQPGKGYHRDLAVGPGGAPALRIACVLNETSIFITPMGGVVRFAGTMEFSGENDVMRRPRLEQLTDGARDYLPALGREAPVSEWCGLRPMSVDGLPIVGGYAGVDGLSVATGHGMLGLTLGPVTGELIANHVMGVEDSRLDALSPSRFR